MFWQPSQLCHKSILRSSRSVSFSRRAPSLARFRSSPGVRKILRRSGVGGSEREGVEVGGGGWGEKESPAVDPKHFTELRSPTNGEQ